MPFEQVPERYPMHWRIAILLPDGRIGATTEQRLDRCFLPHQYTHHQRRLAARADGVHVVGRVVVEVSEDAWSIIITYQIVQSAARC